MNNKLKLKKNLIGKLKLLKNLYPACEWLEECIEMNKACPRTLKKTISGFCQGVNYFSAGLKDGD